LNQVKCRGYTSADGSELERGGQKIKKTGPAALAAPVIASHLSPSATGMTTLHTSTVALKIRFGSGSCQPRFAAYICNFGGFSDPGRVTV
jgi:hypothetical protein